MRELMLQAIYNAASNKELLKKSNAVYDKLSEMVEKKTSAKFAEDFGEMLVEYEFSVFMESCDILLDFISGDKKFSSGTVIPSMEKTNKLLYTTDL